MRAIGPDRRGAEARLRHRLQRRHVEIDRATRDLRGHDAQNRISGAGMNWGGWGGKGKTGSKDDIAQIHDADLSETGTELLRRQCIKTRLLSHQPKVCIKSGKGMYRQ
jgi:hypothetical protein